MLPADWFVVVPTPSPPEPTRIELAPCVMSELPSVVLLLQKQNSCCRSSLNKARCIQPPYSPARLNCYTRPDNQCRHCPLPSNCPTSQSCRRQRYSNRLYCYKERYCQDRRLLWHYMTN